MRRSKKKNRNSESGIQESSSDMESRLDTLIHAGTGKGILGKDKLRDTAPNPTRFFPSEARKYYESNGFIANIIDSVADDATREGIELQTNRDKDNSATGEKGLGISRILLNRMEDLKLMSRIREHIKNSRLHSNGSLLFWGILADLPQTNSQLALKMPDTIRKLQFINVIEPDRYSVNRLSYDPLSSLWHEPSISIAGTTLDPSRFHWLVNSWVWDNMRGVSVLEKIYDGIMAIDTALWSVTSVLFELAVKVLKTDKIDSSPQQMMDYLRLLRRSLSTQSTAMLGEKESLERLGNTGISDSNLDSLLNFVFEVLSGLSKIPKSKIMGKTQSVINIGGGSDGDDLSYNEMVHTFRELEVRPIINRFIELEIRSTQGEIYQQLGGNYKALDWEFKFKPLYKATPSSEADTYLKNAQGDQIYNTIGVLGADSTKQMRFPQMEKFSDYTSEHNNGLNFGTPELPETA